MRTASWIFTIAAVILIISCFFREEMIFITWPIVILACWTDSMACDIELMEFSSRRRRKNN